MHPIPDLRRGIDGGVDFSLTLHIPLKGSGVKAVQTLMLYVCVVYRPHFPALLPEPGRCLWKNSGGGQKAFNWC